MDELKALRIRREGKVIDFAKDESTLFFRTSVPALIRAN